MEDRFLGRNALVPASSATAQSRAWTRRVSVIGATKNGTRRSSHCSRKKTAMITEDHVRVVRDLKAEGCTRVPPMTGRTGTVLVVQTRVLVRLDGHPLRESWFTPEELEVDHHA
jgi:hypothetical protein